MYASTSAWPGMSFWREFHHQTTFVRYWCFGLAAWDIRHPKHHLGLRFNSQLSFPRRLHFVVLFTRSFRTTFFVLVVYANLLVEVGQVSQSEPSRTQLKAGNTLLYLSVGLASVEVNDSWKAPWLRGLTACSYRSQQILSAFCCHCQMKKGQIKVLPDSL